MARPQGRQVAERRRTPPEPDAVTVSGRGVIAGRNADHPAATAALRRTYGLQYNAILALERFVRRLQRRSGDRVIIRISRA